MSEGGDRATTAEAFKAFGDRRKFDECTSRLWRARPLTPFLSARGR